jgi:hypothetical protein
LDYVPSAEPALETNEKRKESAAMHKSTAKVKLPETTFISSTEFKKNSDGSWTCVKNTDIKSPYGIIRVNPGMTFKKKTPHWGIDVAELLDEAESN